MRSGTRLRQRINAMVVGSISTRMYEILIWILYVANSLPHAEQIFWAEITDDRYIF